MKERNITKKIVQEAEIIQETKGKYLEPLAQIIEDIETNPTMGGNEDTAKRS